MTNSSKSSRTTRRLIAWAVGGLVLVAMTCVAVVYVASLAWRRVTEIAVNPPADVPTATSVPAAKPAAMSPAAPPTSAVSALPGEGAKSAEAVGPAVTKPPPAAIDAIPDKPGPLPVDPGSLALTDRFVGLPGDCVLAGGDSPYAFSLHVHRDGTIQIGVYDLTTGNEHVRANLVLAKDNDSPGTRYSSPRLMAGSPDGTLVALTRHGGRDAPLEIWKLDGTPAAVLTIPAAEAWGARWVTFATTDIVLVASSQQQLN